MLASQRRYLLYYREVIARLSGGQPDRTDQAKAELDTAMQAFLPTTATRLTVVGPSSPTTCYPSATRIHFRLLRR
jgi:hypothetical protein